RASRRLATRVAVLLLSTAQASATVQSSCQPSWLPTFGPHTGIAGSSVSGMAVYDDGSGPALYVGGSLSSAGGVVVSNIARWNGTSWSALGAGADAAVLALCVFNDGGGPALYAGGRFASAGGTPAAYIAKWDGVTWSPVGGGMDALVAGLAVFDDGS